jgi:hypothetical protein
LADELELNLEITEKGTSAKLTKDKLEAYGIAGKEYEALPVAEVSTVSIPKNTVLQPMNFFGEKNAKSAIRSVEFPNKTKAFNIKCICVDMDMNLGADEQETLKILRYFLKNSVLKTKLNRADHLSIPLDQCVPFGIEYDGEQYKTRLVRNGFSIKALRATTYGKKGVAYYALTI